MKNILADIYQYSEKLTISQVITFFSRNGITLSKSMIQNYVRDGLLEPPQNKRHYSHRHLAALALISALKNIYGLAEIRAVLDGLSLEKYSDVLAAAAKLDSAWRQNVRPLAGPPAQDSERLALMLHVANLRDSI